MTDAELFDNSETVPIIRGSERSSANMCWQQWYWSWRQGLVKVRAERVELWFGTGVHLALAGWYQPGLKRGPHPVETWREYAKGDIQYVKANAQDDSTVERWIAASELGETMLTGYVEKYGEDPHMDFIQAEKTFELLIPWPTDGRQKIFSPVNKYLAKFVGTYDGVYRNLETGLIELLETKTASAIYLGHLPMDNQAGGYWAVANMEMKRDGLLKRNQSIGGINYNFLRKGTPDARPRNAEGYYTNKPTKEHYAKAMEGKRLDSAVGIWMTEKQLMKMKVAELAQLAKDNGIEVLGEVSKVQPSPLFHRELVHRTKEEQRSQLRRIQDEAVHMEVMRQGLLPITKSPSRDCSWKCPHYDMCELQDRGGNIKEFKSRVYARLDPYADHRKSTSE